MQTHLIYSEAGNPLMPLNPQIFHNISFRTFLSNIYVLLFNTKELTDNMVNLQLPFANNNESHLDTPILLRQFQLKLRCHSVSIQEQSALLYESHLQPIVRIFYKEVWRSFNFNNISYSLAQMQDATGLLANLYEHLFSIAAKLANQATLLYLLAEQLVHSMNTVWRWKITFIASFRQFAFQ